MEVIDFYVSQIKVDERQKRPLGNIDGLIASIQDVGLLHPIVIGKDGRLKVGYRRLCAFQQMERNTIPAHITDNLDELYAALKAERDENLQREDLPGTLLVARKRELEKAEIYNAKLRQGKPGFERSGKFPERSTTGRTRDNIGNALGVSGRTLQKAESIVEASEENPIAYGDLPILMDNRSIHAAHQELKRRKASQPVEVTIFSHESVEYYTPPEFIEAAREVMGVIDLDPASCAEAQEWIKASVFYTEDDDGMRQPWHGRVWLNPPYSKTNGRSNQELWSSRLVFEYEQGNVTEGVLLVKAAMGYKWFENLWYNWPTCFVRERLSFIKSDGTDDGQSKQGTAILYIGPNKHKFRDVFGGLGRVIFPEEGYYSGEAG